MKSFCFENLSGEVKVTLPSNVYQMLIDICNKSGMVETGGILIGEYSSSLNEAIIKYATPPPEDSIHRKTTFYRGKKGLIEKLDNYWLSEKMYYLGEWHFHPGCTPTPSKSDIWQMIKFSSDSNLNCPEPLLIIIGQNNKSWEISATIFIKGEIIPLINKNGCE